MSNVLSYSQLNKFKHCPESWRLHYQEKIRPIAIPSPLIFGSAIGKTFEYLLINYESTVINPEEFFNALWLHQEVNGVITNLKESIDVTYLKSDLDEELASTPWESLRAKAHLMIQAFQTDFLPLVTKVYSTEEKVELFSGDDSNIGYADAVVELKGYDKPIIIDFKTSARKYDHNSVRESIQLGQYMYCLGEKYNTDLAGYVVFLKNINKNRKKICKNCGFDGSGARFKTCNNEYVPLNLNEGDDKPIRCNGEWTETIHPTASVQIIIDTIPQQFQEEIVDEIGLINDSINTGIIERNLEGCENTGYGRPCEYFNLCHNNSMSGLVKLEKKNIGK